MTLTATFAPAALTVVFAPPKVTATTGAQIQRDPVYDGPVEVEPGEEAQVLHTAGFRCIEDIVVWPVPTNYGKVAWNGQYLTIS